MKNRRHVRAAAVASVIALLAVATVGSVRAQDRVPLQLEYEGTTGCTDPDAFTREVLARAPRARIAAPGDRVRTLVARVRPPTAHGYDGVLVVREATGATSERAVHAPSCNELVTALAVIAAVVIDPITARTGAIDAGLATADASPDGGTTAAAGATPNAADAAADAVPTTPTTATSGATEPTPPLPPEPPSRPRRTSDGWEVSAGAGGGAIGGGAPSLMFSIPVFFEIARKDGGVVDPALRLRFERTATAASEEGAFSRTGGAVDFCPIAIRARSLRAQPCARVELAALYATGRGVDPVRSDVRPWFASGAVGRARLDLSAPFFLELEGGMLFAIVRDRFFIEPGTLVYRAPLVGATTAFAVGVAF